MAFKVSFVYELSQDRAGGFTENFWYDNDDLAKALDAASALRPLLKAMHGAQTVNKRCRVAQVGGQRLGRLLRFEDSPAAVGSAGDSDYMTTSLMLELSGSPEGQTRQWIKGIPDDQVSRGGVKTLTAGYVTKFEAFKKELCLPTRDWAVRVDSQVGTFQVIGGVTDNLVLTVEDHGITGMTQVQIKGYKGASKFLNGIKLVMATGPDTLKILKLDPVPGLVTSGTGFIKAHGFTFSKVGDASLVMATKHNVGRPTASPVGRRTTRTR